MRRFLLWMFLADLISMPIIMGMCAGGSSDAAQDVEQQLESFQAIQGALNGGSVVPYAGASSGETPLISCDLFALGGDAAPGLTAYYQDLQKMAGEGTGEPAAGLPCTP